MFEKIKLQLLKLKNIPRSTLKKWAIGLPAAGILLSVLFYLSIYWGMWGKIPSEQELKDLKQNEATEIFSSEGKLIGKYYIFDRQPVLYEELPQHLIDALVATEDVRFYEHSGIDSRSLMRVFFKTLLMGDESSGGGSTITLQLAKNLFGRKDYGHLSIVVNKLRESVIAGRLEDIYSKDEIIGLYFNTVPFSDNTWGIESAARKFYNTTASELTLTQGATLVGTLKASHYYNPRLFPERSLARRNVVLSQMKKYDYLSEEKYAQYKQQPLALEYQYFNSNEGVAPYFRSQLKKDVAAILDTLENENGEKYNIYRDGLQIYTTLDYDMQLLAEEAMTEHMSALQKNFEKAYGKWAPWKKERLITASLEQTEQYKSLSKAGWKQEKIMDSLHRKVEMQLFDWGKKKMVNASIADSIQHYMKFLNMGMINLEPSTGAVKSWVGGINHKYFKYDHVAQSKRQVGSTFKPVVYTAAVEAGIDPCTYYSVREVTYEGGWTPTNSGEEEDPFVNYPMAVALANSINTIAVKVLFDVGLNNVLDQAKKMGFPPNLPPYPSIALGTAELSAADLAGSYASFANGGKPTQPYYITEIKDKYGNTLVKFEPKVAKDHAFSNTTRQVMIEMMKATVNEGTAQRLRYKYGLNNDIAGKTGTTQDNRDGWFVGITPNLVSVTWAGADDPRIKFPSTALGQGANSALPAFALMMQKMNKDPQFKEITQARFEAPSANVQMMLDCEPMERDNFLERLFSKNVAPGQNDKQEKEKKGLFSKIKGLFKKKN
ncbi:penicillin-binding protein 1A [Salinimicrobium catena]|uniref:Penicillin-binding protein 1A n=1 Tax=Salinimicrobium catena TaxID=390640 RepID=A0A1H5M474_9FLAO|nr:transglycosylase domain-containing protein [Salinimicrobium catena]SDL18222.1 penicillin-binding protein 1A [Salinimicrobium catena]SEE84020.1 penicillin-binding protein 1A [Salinimicrobium catena]